MQPYNQHTGIDQAQYASSSGGTRRLHGRGRGRGGGSARGHNRNFNNPRPGIPAGWTTDGSAQNYAAFEHPYFGFQYQKVNMNSVGFDATVPAFVPGATTATPSEALPVGVAPPEPVSAIGPAHASLPGMVAPYQPLSALAAPYAPAPLLQQPLGVGVDPAFTITDVDSAAARSSSASAQGDRASSKLERPSGSRTPAPRSAANDESQLLTNPYSTPVNGTFKHDTLEVPIPIKTPTVPATLSVEVFNEMSAPALTSLQETVGRYAESMSANNKRCTEALTQLGKHFDMFATFEKNHDGEKILANDEAIRFLELAFQGDDKENKDKNLREATKMMRKAADHSVKAHGFQLEVEKMRVQMEALRSKNYSAAVAMFHNLIKDVKNAIDICKSKASELGKAMEVPVTEEVENFGGQTDDQEQEVTEGSAGEPTPKANAAAMEQAPDKTVMTWFGALVRPGDINPNASENRDTDKDKKDKAHLKKPHKGGSTGEKIQPEGRHHHKTDGGEQTQSKKGKKAKRNAKKKAGSGSGSIASGSIASDAALSDKTGTAATL